MRTGEKTLEPGQGRPGFYAVCSSAAKITDQNVRLNGKVPFRFSQGQYVGSRSQSRTEDSWKQVSDGQLHSIRGEMNGHNLRSHGGPSPVQNTGDKRTV